MRKFALIFSALLMCGCAVTTEPGLTAIVGGRLQASAGAAPVPYAVIVIADGKIRAMGPQASTAVPKGAETVNAKGKVIEPANRDTTLSAGQPATFTIRDLATGAIEQTYRDGRRVPQ